MRQRQTWAAKLGTAAAPHSGVQQFAPGTAECFLLWKSNVIEDQKKSVTIVELLHKYIHSK